MVIILDRIKIGAWLPQDAGFDVVKDFALEAEELGYDSIWYPDHLFWGERGFPLECWSTLSALAVVTNKIRLGPMVSSNLFRHPPILAKMAATVDVISKGRLEFGIGGGDAKGETEAYGLQFPEPKVRLAKLKEALQIIIKMWTEEKPSFEGKFYQIKEARCGPKSFQKPYPPISLGGWGDKITPKLAARYSNRYNPQPLTCTLEGAKHHLAVLKEECLKIGRKYENIEKSWFGRVLISKDIEEIRTKRHRLAKKNKYNIIGTPEECVERVREYVALGITYFITWFPEDSRRGMRLFAEEVLPQLARSMR